METARHSTLVLWHLGWARGKCGLGGPRQTWRGHWSWALNEQEWAGRMGASSSRRPTGYNPGFQSSTSQATWGRLLCFGH